MTRENRLEKLDHLRNLALSNDDTRALFKEKTEVIDKLNHNRPGDSYSLEPSPKPEGDIELPKKEKENKSFKESYEDNIKKTRDDYDQKIYDNIEKDFETQGYDEHLEELKELDKTEVGILMENDGAEKLIQYQEEKQHELEKIEVDPEQSMKLSNEERDAIMERGSLIDFEENGKDMDLDTDKTPSPSDDFE